MSLFKLSQYPKFSLPEELRDQVANLRASGVPASTPFATDFSENSETQSLICTLSQGGRLLGYLDIDIHEEQAYLQGMTIEPKVQGRGLGSILMMHGMRKLQSMGIEQARLQCPSELAAYFTRFGFIGLGSSARVPAFEMMYQPSISYFLQHIPKDRQLDGKLSAEHMKLGQDGQSYHFQTESHYTALHRHMLNQARRSIWILSDTINNPVLNSDDTCQAIYRLVKHNPRAEVKILLASDKQGAGQFNPCVNMAQRLSSYIQIRSLQANGTKLNEMITLVDHSASIYRRHIRDFSGFGYFHNRLLFERMKSNFDQHWQFAKPSVELRRLAI